MGRCPTIETERLILRPFREDDVDAYTAVLQTPEVRAALYQPADVGREQALPQHTLPDHAGRPEDHDLHRPSSCFRGSVNIRSVNIRTASTTARRR